MTDANSTQAAALAADLFRGEWVRLIAALTRLLGPSHLALAEDVVQEALVRAMEAWRLVPPRDPKAWILQTARNLAIDGIRRSKRETPLAEQIPETAVDTIDGALTEAEDAENQLAMMFSICASGLSQETHVTLILRFLCGLSPAEIARAFLVDTQTIDRRLHRGRAHLRELGQLSDAPDAASVRERLPSVMQALYLLFNEGYHGSDPDEPMHPAVCTDAIRLGELLLLLPATNHAEIHALVALFCFHAARLPTRLDADGVFRPLAEQDRSLWDRRLIERGVRHLSASATGDQLTPWHIEAGIAAEHALTPAFEATNWRRIVALYDQLRERAPNPIAEIGRGLAVAELEGVDVGREVLLLLENEAKLANYHFYWAARAEIELRAGATLVATRHYRTALALARNDAERLAYERKLRRIAS